MVVFYYRIFEDIIINLMKITKDLVVFITGGASGLGEEAARYLYNLGAKVCVTDINAEGMEKMAAEMSS